MIIAGMCGCRKTAHYIVGEGHEEVSPRGVAANDGSIRTRDGEAGEPEFESRDQERSIAGGTDRLAGDGRPRQNHFDGLGIRFPLRTHHGPVAEVERDRPVIVLLTGQTRKLVEEQIPVDWIENEFGAGFLHAFDERPRVGELPFLNS